MGEDRSEFRYKAFISYSWADAKWGKWLQHAVETYRTPKPIIGTDGKYGSVPARLNPLFKDREEEAAGSSIGAAVEAALADSEFLIVICSPNSAKSEWVNREIAWFKTNRDPDKILALIVGGEPGGGEDECFPKALTHHVAPDMAITDVVEDAPLAADAREEGDGKRMAKLKIAAAMLGVGLDQLVRRDERRQTVRTRVIVTASLALAAVMSTLTWFAIEARNEAERQRAEADGLIEFMLTDLRERLEPVGRLDALDVVGERALEYYAGQDPGSLDPDSLGRRSRALLLVGEISNIRGNSDEALKAFTQAAGTTAELLARDPDNEQRIFDHAQSVFWVGAIAYGRGELEDAEARFREYKRLADRLVELNPDKPEWRLESSYAETNLGVMLHVQDRNEEARNAFANGLTQIEAVAATEEFSSDRQIEVGTMVNWLGIVNGVLGNSEESRKYHQRELGIYDQVLEEDPGNSLARHRSAVVWISIGSLNLDLGEVEKAVAANSRSLSLIEELLRLEPDNTEWQETRATGLFQQVEAMIYASRFDEAEGYLEEALRLSESLRRTDPSNEIWVHSFGVKEHRARMMLALALNDLHGAQLAARESREFMRAQTDRTGEQDSSYAVLALLEGEVLARSGSEREARQAWNRALELVENTSENRATRYALLKRVGSNAELAALDEELQQQGYLHPAYLAER